MYYYDTNSYYAGKVVQYVLDNLSKEGKFYYSFPYDHKNGWRDGQDIYEIDAIMGIVAEQLREILICEVYVSCEYLPLFGWRIVVEVGDRDEL